MSIKHQVDISANETVKDRLAFDRKYQSQAVAIKGYRTDNGVFSAL